MSQLATYRSAPGLAPRPSMGAYAWFVGMAGSWVAFAILAITAGDALRDLWTRVQELPLVAEIVLWVLTLPWMLALAVWESSWDEWLRMLLVTFIAAGWTVISIPRARPRGR